MEYIMFMNDFCNPHFFFLGKSLCSQQFCSIKIKNKYNKNVLWLFWGINSNISLLLCHMSVWPIFLQCHMSVWLVFLHCNTSVWPVLCTLSYTSITCIFLHTISYFGMTMCNHLVILRYEAVFLTSPSVPGCMSMCFSWPCPFVILRVYFFPLSHVTFVWAFRSLPSTCHGPVIEQILQNYSLNIYFMFHKFCYGILKCMQLQSVI